MRRPKSCHCLYSWTKVRWLTWPATEILLFGPETLWLPFLGLFSCCSVLKLWDYVSKGPQVLLTQYRVRTSTCSNIFISNPMSWFTEPKQYLKTPLLTDCNKPQIFTPITILDSNQSWMLCLNQWSRMADGIYIHFNLETITCLLSELLERLSDIL